MAHSSGQGTSTGDFTAALFLGSAALMVLMWVGKPYVYHAYFTMTYYQYRGIEKVVPSSVDERIGVRRARITLANSLRKGPKNYDVDRLKPLLTIPKVFYGSIVFLLFLFMAYRFWRDRPDNYTSKLTVDEMEVHIVQRYWQSAPVIGRRLDRRHPLEDKEWRYARKPWEFAYEYGVITEKDGSKIPMVYQQQEINMVKPTVKELENRVFHSKKADELFRKQLGRRIEIKRVEDVLKLPVEHRALIVPLLSDIDGFYQDRVGDSDKWLKQYALSFLNVNAVIKAIGKKEAPAGLPPFKTSTIDMTGVDDAIRVAFEIPSARKHLMSSAYANTLLVQLMSKTVVMKSCYFRWLKPINRSLWYALNNSGRPSTGHTEGAGPIVHAQWELLAKKPVYVPQIKNATKGLRRKLGEYHWINT